MEDASYQNRRVTRPRSAGTLGLAGPPTVDCSKRFDLPPEVEGGPLERKLHVRSVRREECGIVKV